MAKPGPRRDRSPVLLWFRQDLRLADNAALAAAVSSGAPVVPVFVLDDDAGGAWAPGGAGRWWLHHSLSSLAAGLDKHGAGLLLRRGSAEMVIPSLAAELGAEVVHAGLLAEPWARRQDEAVGQALARHGRRLQRHRVATLFEPDAIRTKTGGSYKVYGPFARACQALDDPAAPLPAPRRIPCPALPASERLEDWGLLPSRPDWAGGLRDTWTPGEAGAQERLDAFMARGVSSYDETRNLPGRDSTSRLSPHLHWGELSPTQVWHAAQASGRGEALDRFLFELLWHEFSAYALWHDPGLPEQPQRPAFGRMRWRDDNRGLRAWQRGLTGVPIVDAGMRQLWRIGWMHNRVRMITASFLVKHLLVAWQDGEAWFWDTLVDADLAANSVSWQWVAGCGSDAQPFFRVFNPISQARKFDPDGDYVRRWVPELADLPGRWLHSPWQAPASVLAKAGVVLGKTYPEPVVELDEGRQRALDTYRRSVRQAA